MATEAAMRPPSPAIVTYRTWTNNSSLQIQPRYEPLPNFVPKRTYAKSKSSRFSHEVKRPKDAFSIGEVLVMDSNLRPSTAAPRPSSPLKPCQQHNLPKKLALIRPSKSGFIEGRCETMARPVTPRGQWLHTVLKPESHFTGPRDVRKTAVSMQGRQLKEFLNEGPKAPIDQTRPEAAEAQVEDSPPIAQIGDYISTDGKDVITTINNALGLPAVPTDLPEAECSDRAPDLDAQIKTLEERVASLEKVTKKSEYQAEFTFANSLVGRTEMVTSLKPKRNQVEFFL